MDGQTDGQTDPSNKRNRLRGKLLNYPGHCFHDDGERERDRDTILGIVKYLSEFQKMIEFYLLITPIFLF